MKIEQGGYKPERKDLTPVDENGGENKIKPYKDENGHILWMEENDFIKIIDSINSFKPEGYSQKSEFDDVQKYIKKLYNDGGKGHEYRERINLARIIDFYVKYIDKNLKFPGRIDFKGYAIAPDYL